MSKTVITLTALNSLLFDSLDVRKALIIAPLRVARDVWPAEIEKWDHLRGMTYAVALGTEAERKEALRQKVQIHIINRENVDWLVHKSGFVFDYDMVILDELSSFKSHQTKRFKSLLKVRPRVQRIVGLTGTPAPNGLMDLWSEFRLLDGGQRLGRYIGQYRDAYFLPDKRNGQIIYSYKLRAGAEAAIYRQIGDITVSVRGGLILPELVMAEVAVKMSDDEEMAYRAMKDEMVLSLEGKIIDAANAAVLSGKLLQMANGAVYDGSGGIVRSHSRKLDALEDLVEAACGKPVLIAYWYRHDLVRILERFPAAERLDGADSIRRWNAGSIPIALIHPASAGHGLNLQSGGFCLIWFGLTWSLELYQQTNARLWRQGQKHTVVVHHILTKGTIDERVIGALRRKDLVQTALVDAVKAELRQ
ncbi:MAG: hypothetical protein DDT35_00418 [Firmicutes bacterium]|nr:hypothetical protein [Bacillota bacterium]